MVAKIHLLALACVVLVVAMAETAAAAAASHDQGKKEEVELDKGSGVSDGGFGQGNEQFTIQLQGGHHVSKPEMWERIVKKDKARAQWIADRLDKAAKEKEEQQHKQQQQEHNG